jgi:hypothetical protein
MKYVSFSGSALEAALSIIMVKSILFKKIRKELGQQKDIAVNAKT